MGWQQDLCLSRMVEVLVQVQVQVQEVVAGGRKGPASGQKSTWVGL